MKILPLVLPLLFVAIPIKASWNYDLKVGECLNTRVENITARWGANFYKYGVEDPIVEFENDISVYPFSARLRKNGELDNYGRMHIEVVKHILWGRPKVTMCLREIPEKCRKNTISQYMPKGDL